MTNFYTTVNLSEPVTSVRALVPDATVRTVLLTTLGHARPLVEDGTATEATPADVELAERLLNATAPVEISAADVESLARVIALGADYMHNNDYVEDESFPEDAVAAAVMGTGNNALEWLQWMLGTPGNTN